MFDQTSRYEKCKDAKIETDDERTIAYKKRRFLPPSEKMQIQHMVSVVAKDRLDNISAKIISDGGKNLRFLYAITLSSSVSILVSLHFSYLLVWSNILITYNILTPFPIAARLFTVPTIDMVSFTT